MDEDYKICWPSVVKALIFIGLFFFVFIFLIIQISDNGPEWLRNLLGLACIILFVTQFHKDRHEARKSAAKEALEEFEKEKLSR